MNGHVNLETTCGERVNAKAIEVNYLIVDALSPCNIILGYPTINALRAVISTRNVVLKYLLPGGRVRTIRGDQQSAKECYQSSLMVEKEKFSLMGAPSPRP